MTTSNEKNIW